MKSQAKIKQALETVQAALTHLLKHDERCFGVPFDELPQQSCVLMGISGALDWVVDVESNRFDLDEMLHEMKETLDEYHKGLEAGALN